MSTTIAPTTKIGVYEFFEPVHDETGNLTSIKVRKTDGIAGRSTTIKRVSESYSATVCDAGNDPETPSHRETGTLDQIIAWLGYETGPTLKRLFLK